ncbi:MAG: hypothetical protein JXR76_08125 [Deltaproteobacteria bacterium]|nr:hypothetical protein [Deltaproteobacteria bacterium]
MMARTESKSSEKDIRAVRDTWKESNPPKQPESREKVRTESLILPMIQGLKVLVVGASKRRREELARTLKKHNIKAMSTTADEHGYRAALKFSPDVAISELAKPGDPGWWLFKRFHRHPALKWTPALIMNWWQEQNGKEVILIESVFERLGEALTPVRLLEERIDAGRKLTDRVETTGMPTVIDVIANAGMTGTLMVNDSWNVFEMDFDNGVPCFALRKGVEGKTDRGHPAFLQVILIDSGHWTFEIKPNVTREKNLFLPLDGLFEWARARLAMLFGPDVSMSSSSLTESLEMDRSLFHDVATTFTGLGRDLLEGIAAGASEKELETIIGKQEERIDAELAMVALVRCGAVYMREQTDAATEQSIRMAKRLAFILEWIAKDHQTEPRALETEGRRKRKATTGFYSFSNPAMDQIHGNVEKYAARKESSATVDLNNGRPRSANGTATTGDISWRRHFSEETGKRVSRFFGVVPHDSFAPGPSHEEKSRLQMWLAIAIAVLLGALLISGLVIIGSDDAVAEDEEVNGMR